MGILLWVIAMGLTLGYVWAGEWRMQRQRMTQLRRAADDAWPREYRPRHASWLPNGGQAA